MKQFSLFDLCALILGMGLALVSLYVPVNYLRKQIFWTETEALIVEQKVRELPGEAEVIYVMDFADERGNPHRIQVKDNGDTFTQGSDSQHIRIYYDPLDATAFELVNPGGYLLILFFPFGLLIAYAGWPKRSTNHEPGHHGKVT